MLNDVSTEVEPPPSTAIFSDQGGSLLTPESLVEGTNEDQQHVVILLDDSSSMSGAPKDEVEKGTNQMVGLLNKDPIMRNRSRLSIIVYDSYASTMYSGARPEDIGTITLNASGATSMGAALQLALEEVEVLKQQLRSEGTDYNKPIIINLTDGQPTDPEEFDEAVEDLLIAEAQDKVSLYTFGCNGANLDYMMAMGTKHAPRYLENEELTEFFENVSIAISKPDVEAYLDELGNEDRIG